MFDDPRVTAVVVAHNRPDELRLVIAALEAQRFAPSRILVVDNASVPPASSILASFSGVEIVRSEANTGGAGGFALALQEALGRDCDWVWMMDDDAVPRPDALKRLVDAARALPASVGALCSAVYEDDALAPMHRRRYGSATGFERVISRSDYRKRACEIDTASFVGFLVRAEAAKNIGLPHADFFLAYDDTEYSLRLKQSGWSLWLVPASGIDHLRGRGARLRGSDFGVKHFYNIRNRLVVASRYSRFGILAALAMGLTIFLGTRSPLRWSPLAFFLRALRDGFRGRLGKVDVL